MGEIIPIVAIGALIVIAIAVVAILVYCLWMVAGFICTTFDWYTMNPLAQWFTFGAFIAVSGVAANGRK